MPDHAWLEGLMVVHVFLIAVLFTGCSVVHSYLDYKASCWVAEQALSLSKQETERLRIVASALTGRGHHEAFKAE